MSRSLVLPTSSNSRRKRLVILVALLALAVVLPLHWEKISPESRTGKSVAKTASGLSSGASPAIATSAPEASRPAPPLPSASASAPVPTPTPSPRHAATVASSAAITPPPEIIRTVTENSVPGRMMFLDFVLDQRGLRLTGATGAEGRAKSLGPRTGFGFIQFEVFDASGRLALAGSVEDPTRRLLEYPAGTPDGKIASTVQFADGGPLAVRLPGEIVPARIVFYRDRNPTVPSSPAREALGEFVLRPSR